MCMCVCEFAPARVCLFARACVCVRVVCVLVCLFARARVRMCVFGVCDRHDCQRLVSLAGGCHDNTQIVTSPLLSPLSPSGLSYEDSYNTLKYADRAKQIKTKVQTDRQTDNTYTLLYSQ